MISVEQKLSVFKQYLLKKQRETGKEIIDAAKEKKNQILTDAEEKLQDDKRNLKERSYHVIFRDKNKIIAVGKNTAKNQMLEQRSLILEDFKKTILKEAENYIGTPLYNEYLKKCLKKVPEIFGNRTDLILFIKPTDRETVEKLAAQNLNGYKIAYDVLPDTVIGGLIIRDTENRINCDFTMANLIRDKGKIIGMRLNEIMDKQVAES